MNTNKVEKLNKVFNKYTRSKKIHEAIVFVESGNGEFSWSKSYGDINLDSPLVMASITKLFTTTCILALLEEGKLSLQDKLTQYFHKEMLSGLHVYGGKDYSFDLTISDLLFQISGLPDVYEEGKDSAKNLITKLDYYLTFDEMVAWAKKLKPRFAPRTAGRAYYADINFDMLGVIIKKVTGTTLSEAFEKFIFNPLGLNKTYLPVKENDFVPCIYNGDKALHRPKFIASSEASGGCISTAREMMVFIKGFFNGSLFNKDILEDLTIYNKLPITMGPIQYGGGHMKIKLDGLFMPFEKNDELLGHSGSTGSLAFYYPQRDIFFVGNVNQMCSPSIPIRLVCQLAMAVR